MDAVKYFVQRKSKMVYITYGHIDNIDETFSDSWYDGWGCIKKGNRKLTYFITPDRYMKTVPAAEGEVYKNTFWLKERDDAKARDIIIKNITFENVRKTHAEAIPLDEFLNGDN